MENMMHMSDKQKAERVVKNIEKMRENSQEMRMWRNIPLARESVELLQSIHDAEAASGMAMACASIVEQLPEYDVPRLVLSILRYKLELVQQSDEHASNKYPTAEEVEAHIRRLEDYIDTEHVSTDEFIERYQRFLKFDPVERTLEWEANYVEVEQECDRRLCNVPRGMGFCFAHWSTLSEVLAERGISWRSPHQMNPRVMFD